MNKITPHLWYDKEAKQAAESYISAFGGNSRVLSSSQLHDTPSGTVDILTIELAGQEFGLISAGPLFRFNPSVSFLVACKTKDEVDALWNRLSPGGTTRMPLDSYPFSERYGWTDDKYGLSWQIMAMGDRTTKQKIIPTLMFVDELSGKAEEAVRFYAATFRDSAIGDINRYNRGEAPDKEGTTRHASFTLENQQFAAMDSARAHNFRFNEAISFIVHCETQQEIDYYWGKLTAVPSAEQCGWLKDKYGVSWQIVPTVLGKMLQDPKKAGRVTQAFLKMKKFDIDALKRAYEQ